MSKYDKEMMSLISHFNQRLNEIAAKGGELTGFENDMMKRLERYSDSLNWQINYCVGKI